MQSEFNCSHLRVKFALGKIAIAIELEEASPLEHQPFSFLCF